MVPQFTTATKNSETKFSTEIVISNPYAKKKNGILFLFNKPFCLAKPF